MCGISPDDVYQKLKYGSPEDIALVNNCITGPKYNDIPRTCSVCFDETEEIYRFCLGDRYKKINCACYVCETCYNTLLGKTADNANVLKCPYCLRIVEKEATTFRDLPPNTDNFEELMTYINKHKDDYNKTTVCKFYY